MLAKRRLRTFGDAKSEAKVMYLPGTLGPEVILSPTVEEEMNGSRSPSAPYSLEWKEPERVRGIPGDKLPKFQSGQSLRQWGKYEILKSLRMIPTPTLLEPATIPGEESIRTFPLHFVDGVADFGAVPFGAGNNFGQEVPEVTTGDWGNLISTIAQGAQQVLETEKAKYTAQIQAVQARIMTPTTAGVVDTMSKYFPYLIVGGIAIIFLMRKKKGKKEGR